MASRRLGLGRKRSEVSTEACTLTPESGPACLAPGTRPLEGNTVTRSAQDLGQRQERKEGWGRQGEAARVRVPAAGEGTGLCTGPPTPSRSSG